MQKVDFKMSLAKDRQSVGLTMTIGAKNIGTASLDTADMDDLIFKSYPAFGPHLPMKFLTPLIRGAIPSPSKARCGESCPFGSRLAMRSIFGILDMDG